VRWECLIFERERCMQNSSATATSTLVLVPVLVLLPVLVQYQTTSSLVQLYTTSGARGSAAGQQAVAGHSAVSHTSHCHLSSTPRPRNSVQLYRIAVHRVVFLTGCVELAPSARCEHPQGGSERRGAAMMLYALKAAKRLQCILERMMLLKHGPCQKSSQQNG
jgi:hypothetical protein